MTFVRKSDIMFVEKQSQEQNIKNTIYTERIYMDINKIIKELEDCPCGRAHTVDIKAVKIGRGLKERTADILKEYDFPRRLLAVADKNTLNASCGIIEILEDGGFEVKLKLYENFREPHISFVHEIEEECKNCDAILSIGTGSLNDICRMAALTSDKEFAIFATAPSMDGFASATSPIIENNIKSTLPARQPSIIIADTEILAHAPTPLKSAGFGDVIGKLTAITDWRISNLLSGEYYCERIADLVRNALKKLISMADKVTKEDAKTAGFIMETLVLTGLAMKLAGVSRPASGAEHMISHFWGMKKLEEGKPSDFHGKKVGIATLALTEAYRNLASDKDIEFCDDAPDWSSIYDAYGPKFYDYVKEMNLRSATEGISPKLLSENWDKICSIIKEELPTAEELKDILTKAGCATKYNEADIDAELARLGLLYHPYMRHKIILSRLLAMTNRSIDTLTSICS